MNIIGFMNLPKNHINRIEPFWSFAKRRLAPFNKIGNGLKNFLFMNFDGITKIQICLRLSNFVKNFSRIYS